MTIDLDRMLRSQGRIASFPAIVARINQAVDDPRGSMDTIARIITEDPSLAARLLKIANSSFYNTPFPVNSISRALTMIGTKQLKDLVAATFVLRMFGKLSKGIDMDAFWRHSIACGVAARVIATARREINVERFYLAGLLHDVGQLVILNQLPEEAGPLLEKSAAEKKPIFTTEREVLGFDHGEVGGRLLQQWRLPAELHLPVWHHHTPSAAEDFLLETAIVHVADLLAVSIRHGSGIEPRVPPLDAAAWERIHLPISSVPNLLVQIKAQFTDALTIFMKTG